MLTYNILIIYNYFGLINEPQSLDLNHTGSINLLIATLPRLDVCEQAAKDAKIRAEKAEEEVADLIKKAQQLEVHLTA